MPAGGSLAGRGELSAALSGLFSRRGRPFWDWASRPRDDGRSLKGEDPNLNYLIVLLTMLETELV
jgi:hypothetical protein